MEVLRFAQDDNLGEMEVLPLRQAQGRDDNFILDDKSFVERLEFSAGWVLVLFHIPRILIYVLPSNRRRIRP